MRKATSRDAISEYRSLIEASNHLFLKNALGMVGDPSPLVNQYAYFVLLPPLPRLTRDCRGIGELVIRITYSDALSKKETKELINLNEETIRLTAEAVGKVYLVNIIPMRTLVHIPIKRLIHLRSTSQAYPFLGTRRWVPAVSCPYQAHKSHNPQWSLGEGPQGYRELMSLSFTSL